MEDKLIQNALAYAACYQLQLVERLGFGIHGIIFSVVGNRKDGTNVIKVHREEAPFIREVEAYARLKAAGIRKVLGFNVPVLIRIDNSLRVIEMSLVTRPFLLDFAGAYLDAQPEFSPEVWEQWEVEKMDQFENRWMQVRKILQELEGLGIHMIDVTPSNIAFEE
jgi:hypothetical protein